MPFSVSTEHIQFFNQNSKIEFENLLNLDQLKILNQTFSSMRFPTGHALISGFETWRDHPKIKNIVCRAAFAKLAAQLKNLNQIRYGFSQYLGPKCYSDEDSFLFRKSFIKELVCGVCFCLKEEKEPQSPFFPEKAQSAIFFDIDEDFFLKFPKTSGEYLFIFYADHKARFYIQEQYQEFEAYYKKLGYQHGDFLRDSMHQSYEHILL